MGCVCINISIHFSEESGFICLCVCGGGSVSFLRRTILDTWPAREAELLWGIWHNTETLHDFGCGSRRLFPAARFLRKEEEHVLDWSPPVVMMQCVSEQETE